MSDEGTRAAITEPIRVFNKDHRSEGSEVLVTGGFVDQLLRELKQADTSAGRAGVAAGVRHVELPYLQLALEKIWRAAGGPEARALNETLLEARGVRQIIADHLDGVMSGLDADQQAACAHIFDRLVTPSGAKYAMAEADLASFARLPDAGALRPILRHLGSADARVLKEVPSLEGVAVEIFHDVLGPPILRWKERFDAASEAAAREQAERERREKEAKEAAAREEQLRQHLARAQAALIWSEIDLSGTRIEAHEVDALWQLATADEAVSEQFLVDLARGRGNLVNLARRPNPVFRALGLKLSTKWVQAVLGPTLQLSGAASESSQLGRLARIVRALGTKLTAHQAQAALAPVLDAIKRTTDPDQLRALAQAVQALAPRPRAGPGGAGTRPRGHQGHHRQRSAPGPGAGRPGPGAQARAGPGGAGTRARGHQGHHRPLRLQALAQAVQALAPRLGPEQAQAALAPVLEAIKGTTDPVQLQALAQAVQALAPRLAPEQAQAALAPVLDAIKGTTDPYQLRALAQAVQALAPRPEQAQAALAPVLEAIKGTTDSDQLRALAQAVQALAPRPEQAQAALAPVLEAIKGTTDTFSSRPWRRPSRPWRPGSARAGPGGAGTRARGHQGHHRLDQLQALAQAVQALAPRLGPEQAQAALAPVLDAIKGTTDPGQLRALAQAVQALAPRLGPEQAQAALAVARSGLAYHR